MIYFVRMKRITFPTGTFEVNSTILFNEKEALVVDPGADAPQIAAEIRKNGATLKAILLTHAHFDHIGGVKGLLEEFPGTAVYLGDGDFPVVTHPFNQLPPDYPPCEMFPNTLSAEHAPYVETISTPGHTPGGVCYFIRNFDPQSSTPHLLLSGDTLFFSSVGRTDLPGGDMATLSKSLAKLKLLPKDTLVIPGHGPETTIEREISENPFLA